MEAEEAVYDGTGPQGELSQQCLLFKRKKLFSILKITLQNENKDVFYLVEVDHILTCFKIKGVVF